MTPSHAASRILVLDGHDGAGKTTLGARLARHAAGRLVRPFRDTLGDMITWLWKHDRHALADAVACAAVEKAISENDGVTLLVFDRHWLCLFTVLPESHYAHWFPLPPTVLVWTDVETTCERLVSRGEPIESGALHEHYCRRYRELAARFEVPVLDTTGRRPEESMEELLALAPVRALLDRGRR